MTFINSLARKALTTIRRGDNGVIWSGEGKRGGNYLYIWLQSHTNQQNGLSTPFLYRENMESWLNEFPSLRELTIHRDKVGFTTPRLSVWPIDYGTDFSAAELDDFLRERILSSKTFASSVEQATNDSKNDDLLINVRRGDYYSAEFEPNYGINIGTYIRDSLDKFDDFDRVRIISDDISWCRANSDLFPKNHELIFGGNVSGPFGDLASIAVAKRLILPNSTFSYWGGFLSDLIYDRQNTVVAPVVHERIGSETQEWSLPQHWSRIDTVPSILESL